MVVSSSGRSWPRQLAEVIEQEVEEMLKMGVIEPARGPWRSYPVVVPKPDGSERFCIDYCKVNAMSKFDARPMPKVGDLLDQLGSARFLFSVGLMKGYWQILLREQDRGKTASAPPKAFSNLSKFLLDCMGWQPHSSSS